jgi:hypothetical protein
MTHIVVVSVCYLGYGDEYTSFDFSKGVYRCRFLLKHHKYCGIIYLRSDVMNSNDDYLSNIARITASGMEKVKEVEITPEERAKLRAEISVMHDRLIEAIFADNKNNPLITDTANVLRKIHKLPLIPPITYTKTQKSSVTDFLERKMIADLLGGVERVDAKGRIFNILNLSVEVQQSPQDGYEARAILSSSNAFREGFAVGMSYDDAPDVVSINIMGYKLPSLDGKKEFFTRIVRSDYDYPKRRILADKYSDYLIELPKLGKKSDWHKKYHELWDLCAVFKSKVSEYDEVMKMVASPVAKSLLREAKIASGQDVVIDKVLHDTRLEDYIYRRLVNAVADKEAEKNAEIAKLKELLAQK